MKIDTQTIAAIATPAGDGGIAVIRVSGATARQVVGDSFRGRSNLSSCASHTAHVGHLVEKSNAVLDQVVCTVFIAPHSYTGEDVVEVSCHGGHIVARRVLDLVLRNGARAAGPGEFTRRAFLNGKIDLTQAEAIAELIHARSDAARRASTRQLEGTLSAELSKVRHQLVDALSLLELELDFAEEGYDLIDRNTLAHMLRSIRQNVEDLLDSYVIGRVYRDGVRVALIGSPNAGKSSLLNALLRESRAIVTEIPGTTRDVITESILINGLLFQVTDTAGLRQTADPVESEGIRRAHDQIDTTDILVWVVDRTRDPQDQWLQLGDQVRSWITNNPRMTIVALNKSDIANKAGDEKPELKATLPGDIRSKGISSLTGEGVAGLEIVMFEAATQSFSHKDPEGAVITSARHQTALIKVKDALQKAEGGVASKASSELLAIDLRSALESIGEITGEVTSEEVLDAIFSRFCIGK